MPAMKPNSYVVVVEFTIDSLRHKDFVETTVKSAELSLATEPGCQRFDVLVHPESPEKVYLYEIYDSRAAFDDHHNTEHFFEWQRLAKPHVKELRSHHVREAPSTQGR